jgi:hypothetical protein
VPINQRGYPIHYPVGYPVPKLPGNPSTTCLVMKISGMFPEI